ncbi:AMP-binding enzyme [Raineyella sp. LH-20]|uniref:AMP-binding enzyme n=1 Tax=Raineyella sp. LH-20 TaxID=3081204 RepID=UPI0029541EE0|nr:o-succinylbenzoate--CoA ligase [Raineyella sp. LH-20]WOP18253.1 o-succinylbenzoate--CoA ligase [Raineyella sp. LH-20]
MTTDGAYAVAVLEGPDPVAAFWQAHHSGRDIALSTSGTTSGTARTIIRSTASWVDSFDLCARRLALGSADRFWVPGPLTATMNLFAACLASFVGAGWSSDRVGCTHAQLTPARLAAVLDESPTPGLRVLVAGDSLAPALRQRAEAAGLRVDHYYGAAELSLVAWGHDAADLRLFEAVTAEVRDGALWVRSPWLARGVADDRGFATVGDLVRLDGDRVEVLGRPGAATTAGTTVELAPVEAELQAHGQKRVVVVAVPHERLGEVICCVTSAADREAVQRWGRTSLTGARRPRRWLVRDALPLTPTGKVDRLRLVEEITTTDRSRHLGGAATPIADGDPVRDDAPPEPKGHR